MRIRGTIRHERAIIVGGTMEDPPVVPVFPSASPPEVLVMPLRTDRLFGASVASWIACMVHFTFSLLEMEELRKFRARHGMTT